MLSLSLFSSSQTISVALYRKSNLIRCSSRKISGSKNELLFILLKKVLKEKDYSNLKKIFFCSGPGSFTALRSIKAIAQGIAIATKSEVYSINKFDCLYYNFLNEKKKILMFFKSSQESFVFQFYNLSEKKTNSKSKIFFGNYDFLNDYYKKLKSRHEDLILVSDCKKNSFILRKNEKSNFKFFNLNAKSIAKACFSGLGKENLEIFYHSAYYEKK